MGWGSKFGKERVKHNEIQIIHKFYYFISKCILLIEWLRQAFSGGEMQTMKYLGHEVGDARFQTHWDTFITEEDIANIGKLHKLIKRLNIFYFNFQLDFWYISVIV